MKSENKCKCSECEESFSNQEELDKHNQKVHRIVRTEIQDRKQTSKKVNTRNSKSQERDTEKGTDERGDEGTPTKIKLG